MCRFLSSVSWKVCQSLHKKLNLVIDSSLGMNIRGSSVHLCAAHSLGFFSPGEPSASRNRGDYSVVCAPIGFEVALLGAAGLEIQRLAHISLNFEQFEVFLHCQRYQRFSLMLTT